MCNQLYPPCRDLAQQLSIDTPVLDACLHAGLAHDALVIHTSGNWALPTEGKRGIIDGMVLDWPATVEPAFSPHWPSYAHVFDFDGIRGILGEAKHRMDMYIHMFMQVHPDSRACIVLPCPVYGRGYNRKVTWWDLWLPAWLEGRLRDFPSSYVHVEDVAEAYLAVVQRGEAGGRYMLAGESMLVSDYYKLYAAAAGVAVTPEADVYKGPLVTFDDAETQEKLDWYPRRTVHQTMPEHVAYLITLGLLPRADGAQQAAARGGWAGYAIAGAEISGGDDCVAGAEEGAAGSTTGSDTGASGLMVGESGSDTGASGLAVAESGSDSAAAAARGAGVGVGAGGDGAVEVAVVGTDVATVGAKLGGMELAGGGPVGKVDATLACGAQEVVTEVGVVARALEQQGLDTALVRDDAPQGASAEDPSHELAVQRDARLCAVMPGCAL